MDKKKEAADDFAAFWSLYHIVSGLSIEIWAGCRDN
jgi:hypothetical protein